MTDRVAVLIPCLNEETTIGRTIAGFRAALPEATVYVFDNNSSDNTAEVAAAAGAVVFHEPRQGKGCVVRRMFSDVEADAYILVDGDLTYDPAAAPTMVDRLRRENLDMVVGVRDAGKEAYRPGHFWGNRFFNKVVRLLFGKRFTDIFSGYRVLSRRLVKSFPALSTGFEIETELLIHTLELRLPTAEVKTRYRMRPEGSHSKLKTWRHSLVILSKIATFFTQVRAFTFFGVIAMALFALGMTAGWSALTVFIETGKVPYLPRAVLAASLMTMSALSLVCGLILHNVNQARREIKRMHYLAYETKR